MSISRTISLQTILTLIIDVIDVGVEAAMTFDYTLPSAAKPNLSPALSGKGGMFWPEVVQEPGQTQPRRDTSNPNLPDSG